MTPPGQPDLARSTLIVLVIGAMMIGSYVIVRPFLTPIIWSGVVVMATWPVMLRVQRWLWGRRWLAASAMTIGLVLVFILPLVLAGSTIVNHSGEIAARVRSLASAPPPPPEWLARVPVVGPKIAESWVDILSEGVQGLAQRLTPYLDDAARWMGATLGSFGVLLVNFLLVIIVAAILYTKGETVAAGMLRLARRLAPEKGEKALAVATRAIRGVALGVVVTAIVQAVLGGIGLAVCGVPLAALLTAVIFLLSVAQLGAGLVLLPALLWLYWKGDTTWGTVLLIWTAVVVNIDNFLRPVLIQRGANLPLLLVFVGVVGGLLAFGLMGVFVGPVLLAVAYELLVEWVKGGEGTLSEQPQSTAATEPLPAAPSSDRPATRSGPSDS